MNVSRLRQLIQILAFGLLVFGGFINVDLTHYLPVCSCTFNDAKGGSCFLAGLQCILTKPFDQYPLDNWWPLLKLTKWILYTVLFFVILNKAWCGWLCPFGTIQDWLTILRRRSGIECARFSWLTHDKLKSVKYILLFLLIILSVGIGNSLFGLPRLTEDLHVPMCQICPARPLIPIFTGDFSQFFINFKSTTKIVMSTLGMTLLGLVLVGSFVKKRFWCAYCPISAFTSLFDNLGLMQLKKDGQRCTKCGNCSRVCDMEIREIAEERDRENIVTQDCMLCMRCIEACPEDLALKATFLGKNVFASSFEGFMARQCIKAEGNRER